VSTEYEFVTTYRGVVVPGWIPTASENSREAFKAGVDGALNGVATPVNHDSDEPRRDLRYRDKDGDRWDHLPGAGWGWYSRVSGKRYDQGDWGLTRAGFPDLTLTPEEA
jgi:hypothetical protein